MKLLKPFNLEEALTGKPVITRKGYPIVELKYLQTISCLTVVHKEPDEKLISYFIRCVGTHNDTINYVTDLFIAPTKKEGWINIYHGQHSTVSGRIVYTTEEAALANKDTSSICIETIKIEWEE